ncbi:exopolyphosphatase [Oricola thermophila]|uniref:exopolyphosphatase n=1 Tax=Oricola thermophila TaxID=2742145 RepID=UPI0018D7594F|nr:exopolyphosphatase [Oricola thermophila]
METEDAQGRLRNRRPIAVVDIGSNSVRLVIYEGLVRAPSILFNEKVQCGLGRGIAETGNMDEGAVRSALDALRRFRALADQGRVERLVVLATAAAREAGNGPAFIEEAERILGQEITVLSGREEALYSAYGVQSAFRAIDGVMGDLGGGSLEVVDMKGEAIGEGMTLPIGVIRLSERAGGELKQAVKIARQEIKRAAFLEGGRGRTFYAVGGTWRNLAKLHMANTGYPLHVTHHYEMDAERAAGFLGRVGRNNVEKMRGIGQVSRSRRSLLPYGAIVLAEIIRAMKPEKVVFSSAGVREGYLYGLLDEETRKRDALIEAAEELSILRSRSPRHARELAVWTGNAFRAFGIDETEDEARYREAACRLADISWRAHPDYRGDQALNVIAYGSFTQIDHPGRAYIALANYFRHDGLKNPTLAPEIRTITSDRIWERSRYLGAFFRVAYLFTAAMPGVIGDITWREKEDGSMELVLPRRLAELHGSRPLGRINQLSKVVGRPIALVVED